jgi:hypothetical protein
MQSIDSPQCFYPPYGTSCFVPIRLMWLVYINACMSSKVVYTKCYVTINLCTFIDIETSYRKNQSLAQAGNKPKQQETKDSGEQQ